MDITADMQKAGLEAYELLRASPHINTPDRVVQDVFSAMIAVAPGLVERAVDAVETEVSSLVETIEEALGLAAQDGVATEAPIVTEPPMTEAATTEAPMVSQEPITMEAPSPSEEPATTEPSAA